MKKFIMIIIAAMFILSSCSNNTDSAEPTDTAAETQTEEATQASDTPTLSPEPTLEPTPSPEPFDVDSISSKSLNGLLNTQDIPEETTQLILVAVDNNAEKMYLMEKHENGMWQVVHGPFEVQIGRNGLGKDKEGDGKSPQGLYELGYAFGRDGAPSGTVWPWRDSEDGDIWVEDSRSEYYNLFMQEGTIEEPDWVYYSNLNIMAFARAVEIRYNSERVPEAGSAIFLHIWISPKKDTHGCTSTSRENMETLIRWLDPSANTMIAQLPYELLAGGDLVYLSDYSYDIAADIKFAGDDNILGTALEGYNDNQIITKPEIAKALVSVNNTLEKYGAKLVVYEAYRPMDAFTQIREWIVNQEDITGQEEHYKGLDKLTLKEEYFPINADRLYIRGQIVHVSLQDLYGNELDMGSEYMVFDEKASYMCDDLTAEQINNRELLHDLMVQAGFSAYENQWWKFAYNPTIYVTQFEEIIE